MDSTGDKPNGLKAGWHCRASRYHFRNKISVLREDDIELANGAKQSYAYLERAEAVVIVPVTNAGEVILLRQYRYPVDEWCLEVPAGGTHDNGGCSLEEVARKELREEVGAKAGTLTYVNFFYSASSLTDEKCHVYLAEDVTFSEEPERESSESIETKLVPAGEAVRLARTGAIKTAPCALALLLCEPLLINRGYAQSGRSTPSPRSS